jgi:hypothetical protein
VPEVLEPAEPEPETLPLPDVSAGLPEVPAGLVELDG